jgi:hypothetical protein
MRAAQYLIDVLSVVDPRRMSHRERAAYYNLLRQLERELSAFLEAMDGK